MIFPLFLELDYYRTSIITYFLIAFSALALWYFEKVENGYPEEAAQFCESDLELYKGLITIKQPVISRIETTFNSNPGFTDLEKCQIVLSYGLLAPFEMKKVLKHAKDENLNFKYNQFLEIAGKPYMESYAFFPKDWNIFKMTSSAFLHSGKSHLIFNMFYLFLFGRALELVLGPFIFFTGILITNMAACLTYSFFVMGGLMEPMPSVGASGYIFGLMGMFLYILPKVKVRMFYWFLIRTGTFSLSAWVIIIFYFFEEVFNLTGLGSTNVNIPAHLGGFLGGFFFAKYLGKKYDYV